MQNVWPAGHTDGVEVEGLARGDYKLWSLWVWLYCIVWWFVQDSCKVLTYYLIYKFDIFHATSGQFVNMREAQDPADETHRFARASVGVVEGKVMTRKVSNAMRELENADMDEREKTALLEVCVCRLAIYMCIAGILLATTLVTNSSPQTLYFAGAYRTFANSMPTPRMSSSRRAWLWAVANRGVRAVCVRGF